MRNRLAEQPVNPVYEALARKRARRHSAHTQQSSEWGERVTARFDQSRRSVARLIAAHPLISLSAAVSVGIVFGWWVKRK